MNIHIELIPILSIISGILILIRPKLLSYIVAVYIIVAGCVRLISGYIK